MDLKKIDNVELDGIGKNDYPDFADAYIVSADYNGKPMTEEEIESIDSEFVYEKVLDHFF